MAEQKKKTVSGDPLDLRLLRKVYGLIAVHRQQAVIAVLLTIGMAMLGAVRPKLIQESIDRYVLVKDSHGLLMMTLILIGMLLLQTVFQFYQTFLAVWLGQNAVKNLRNRVFKLITKLRLSYLDKTPVGTLVTRSISDIETISDTFSEGLIIISGDILQLVFILFFMFNESWRLSLTCLSVLPLLLFSAWLFKVAVKKSFQEVRNAVAKLNAFVQEHLTGMQVIQIFGIEKQEYEKFKKINKEHTDANIRGVFAYSIFFPVVEIITALSIALLVWYGLRGMIQGKDITFGTITAFILYINMFYRPIRLIADRFNTMQMGMVAAERIFKLLEDKTITEVETGALKPEVKGAIEFKNVSFSYTGEVMILKNISFSITPGKTLAIVGATGSGKTTIINLLNRFYPYHQGRILLDGVNINDYELEYLRKNMGLVLQDVFLFAGSIRDNISMYDESISDEQVRNAAEAVGADNFIRHLQGGYDYDVMERGGTLSAGQRQLISFARALAFDPKVLILDEATSSIDSESEELIQNAIRVLLSGRTSIVIAHRLSTIQNADEIMVLDHGEIKERGTHQSLLQANGFYRKLYMMQFQEPRFAVKD